jgi:hypothetical protein
LNSQTNYIFKYSLRLNFFCYKWDFFSIYCGDISSSCYSLISLILCLLKSWCCLECKLVGKSVTWSAELRTSIINAWLLSPICLVFYRITDSSKLIMFKSSWTNVYLLSFFFYYSSTKNGLAPSYSRFQLCGNVFIFSFI